MGEAQQSHGVYYQEPDYESGIRLRIDAEKVLAQIRTYLSGFDYVYDDQTRTLKKVKVGEPIANDQGIQRIMFIVTTKINPQTVQGNWKEDRFDLYLARFNADLALAIQYNRLDWGIGRGDYDVVVDAILDMAEPFLSRLLDNKERESYPGSMQVIQRDNPDQAQRKQPWFG